MPRTSHPSRWQEAVTAAASSVLASRWRYALECLELAWAEQAQLLDSPLSQARAARTAARRIKQLEHLRMVLAHRLRP